jgi:hypothetical protein
MGPIGIIYGIKDLTSKDFESIQIIYWPYVLIAYKMTIFAFRTTSPVASSDEFTAKNLGGFIENEKDFHVHSRHMFAGIFHTCLGSGSTSARSHTTRGTGGATRSGLVRRRH